jgi:hypothetical protein
MEERLQVVLPPAERQSVLLLPLGHDATRNQCTSSRDEATRRDVEMHALPVRMSLAFVVASVPWFGSVIAGLRYKQSSYTRATVFVGFLLMLSC